MQPDIVVPVHEKTDVAAARRAALELAAFPPESNGSEAGALSLVVTEAATNLIKHGGGGQIVLRRMGASSEVEVIAMDKGPGLMNPGRAFEDGYSTAGSPGTGLGAVARLSSFYDFYSAPQRGLVLVARVGTPATNGNHLADGVEYGSISAPYPGESVSGDGWAISIHERTCRVIVADGLGHGVLAAEASAAAVETSLASPSLKLEEVLEKCHARLRPTRGAAVSIADADFAAGSVRFAGVGNVAGVVLTDSAQRRQMVSVNGTVGHEMRKTQSYTYPLSSDSLVVMHSDGLSANWGLEKYPGLFYKHPSVIAGVLFRDYRRDRDDATVVVARARVPSRS